jgi:beta-N-acetylhexosaminidase
VDSLRARPQPLAVVSYGDDRSPNAGLRLASELRQRGYAVSAFRLGPGSGTASYDSAAAVAALAPLTVFAVAIRPAPWHINGITLPTLLARLIDATAAARRTVLVSEGTPYMVRETPAVSSYLLAWAADRVSEAAVARALAGAAPINGRLPITIPPRYPLGAGLQRGAGVGATH